MISDRGTQFMSRLVSALCEMFDVTRHHCSSYYPKTNSACERINSTMAQTLRAYVDKDQKNWADFLPAAMMAFSSSPASGTGLSPFHLLFGKEMNLPIDTSLIPKTTLGLDAQHYFERVLERLKAAKEIAGTNIRIAQEKSKQRHDVQAKDPGLKVGDYVLLKSIKVPKGYSPKLYPKSNGPFYITELGPNFTYKLRSCVDHSEVKCLINASRLRKYVNPGPIRREPEEPEVLIPERQDQQQQDQGKIQEDGPQIQTWQADEAQNQPVPAGDPADRPKAPDQDIQSQEDQEINCYRQALRILRSKTENRERKYLVRWEDSWEPEENLTKLREKFPYRVLTKRITASVPYCNVRWKDTWEPVEKCNDVLIQRYNIARANKKHKIRNRPQPRHEHFLRSKIPQSDQGKKPIG